MKRTRLGYTVYSPQYSQDLPQREWWEFGAIRGAKRKARSFGVASVIVRDFTQEDRRGRLVGDWWQTNFCWVWNGLEFVKAYPVLETKWLVADHRWFEFASLMRLRSSKS